MASAASPVHHPAWLLGLAGLRLDYTDGHFRMDGFESSMSLAGRLSGAVPRQPKARLAGGSAPLAQLQKLNTGPRQLSWAFHAPNRLHVITVNCPVRDCVLMISLKAALYSSRVLRRFGDPASCSTAACTQHLKFSSPPPPGHASPPGCRHHHITVSLLLSSGSSWSSPSPCPPSPLSSLLFPSSAHMKSSQPPRQGE